MSAALSCRPRALMGSCSLRATSLSSRPRLPTRAGRPRQAPRQGRSALRSVRVRAAGDEKEKDPMDMSSVSLEQDTELRAALEAQGKGKDPFGFSDGRTSAEPDRIEPGFATQNAKVGPVGELARVQLRRQPWPHRMLHIPRTSSVDPLKAWPGWLADRPCRNGDHMDIPAATVRPFHRGDNSAQVRSRAWRPAFDRALPSVGATATERAVRGLTGCCREAAGPVAGLEDPTAALQPYQMQ
eukprot:scaffold4387_cov400-Prasinococcus_capsulatus_cf.AAC.2